MTSHRRRETMTTDTVTESSSDTSRIAPDGDDDEYQVNGSNWGPSRFSILLPLVVGGGMIGLFAWFVDDVLIPLGIGATGALAFTLLIWLVDLPDEGVSTLFSSLLTIVVGAGLFGGTAAMALLLGSELFPIEDLSFLSLSTLLILGHVGVILGCSLVLFGSTVGLRNIEMGKSLQQSTGIALTAAVIPGAVSLTFAALTIASAGDIAGPATLWELLSGFLREVFISTTANALHLSSFLFLLALFLVSCYLAIIFLPVSELLADRGVNSDHQSLSHIISGLIVSSMGLFLASILWLFVEQSFTPVELRNLLGTTVYDTIRAITAVSGFRMLLASASIVLLVVTAIVYAIQRVAQSNVDTLSRRAAALVGGAVITIGGAWIAQPIFEWLVLEIETRLPGMVAGEFREFTDQVAAMYGAETIVLLLLTAVIGLTVTVLLLFRLFLFIGYLPNESMGPSIASAGLFLATVFAATIDTPSWLILTGVVATFLVWDAGRYGVTMGAEIGRRAPTRGPEVVHSAATLIVGALAAGGAVVLLRTEFQLTAPVGTVALLSVLLGLLFILESLR